jgi:hypothetical protein
VWAGGRLETWNDWNVWNQLGELNDLNGPRTRSGGLNDWNSWNKFLAIKTTVPKQAEWPKNLTAAR